MIRTPILLSSLPERFPILVVMWSLDGRQHVQFGWQRLAFAGAGTPEFGILSAYVSGMSPMESPMGEEAHPGRAGRPVGVDLGRIGIGWHTYQSCQRDLGRDAGWKLGTWRLMHGPGPASASVLPSCGLLLLNRACALLREMFCVPHVMIAFWGSFINAIYSLLMRVCVGQEG